MAEVVKSEARPSSLDHRLKKIRSAGRKYASSIAIAVRDNGMEKIEENREN